MRRGLLLIGEGDECIGHVGRGIDFRSRILRPPQVFHPPQDGYHQAAINCSGRPGQPSPAQLAGNSFETSQDHQYV